ncbi:hypothetical protein RHMOL_Rhmol01G0101300 [Rhododendron molle]|nr:hypothetical protein RHMOL_Rhmol01G0101300 [Rhododendron molle]
MTISGDVDDVLPPKHRLELAMQRWNRIVMIMGRKDVKKFTWNLKVQIQVVKVPAVSIQRLGSLNLAVKTLGLELVDSSYYVLSLVFVRDGLDMCIVAWNMDSEVKKRLSSEAAAAANRSGRWKNQVRIASHNGCCRRVAQTGALYSVLWKLLISEELVEALLSIEIPLGCLQARQVLGRKLRYLEKEADRLAGMTFSLYSVPDIANVLYGRLMLPIPEGSNRAKQHPSTDKHCLDLLRHEHPSIPVIKEHRSLAKLLNCTLGSICSLARLSIRTQKNTLHGHWLQTSTATWRLSMEESNLQCVEHMVEFENDKDGDDSNVDCYCINARDFFLPTEVTYVKTLKGRKCFSQKLNLETVKKVGEEKVKYAIASFQGSAADIIKIAMINILSLIVGEVDDSDPATVAAKFHMLRSPLQNPFAVLHNSGFHSPFPNLQKFTGSLEVAAVWRKTDTALDRAFCYVCYMDRSVVHDELVLEADPSVIKEAGWLLQMSMERAASLLSMSSEIALCISCCLLLVASSFSPAIVWDLLDVRDC